MDFITWLHELSDDELLSHYQLYQESIERDGLTPIDADYLSLFELEIENRKMERDDNV